jgi:hypothetical protein
MPEPQQFVAGAMRLYLRKFVRIRNNKRLYSVSLTNPICEPLRRASHRISRFEYQIVERQVKMHIAEVSDDLGPTVLRLHDIRNILVDWLGEYDYISGWIVDLRAHFCGGNGCTVAVTRHAIVSIVTERYFHDDGSNETARLMPSPFDHPRFSRASMIAAKRPPPKTVIRISLNMLMTC